MTATALTPATTTVASDAANTRAVRRMWAVGAVAGVVSSLVVIALVAIAEGAGVPMEVAENSTKQPEQIPLLGYGTVILGSTLVGLLSPPRSSAGPDGPGSSSSSPHWC